MVDFAAVRREHIFTAVERIRCDGVPPRRNARSTRVHVGGATWPAKYVLGLAWEAAYGRALDSEDYTGGLATARVLTALGFDVDHEGTRLPGAPVGHVAEPGAGGSPLRRLMATSVAMTGSTSQGPRDNAQRMGLLDRVIDAAIAEARPGDSAVLVLPGGYFRLGGFVGDLNAGDRRTAIEGADFASACMAGAAKLASKVPGAVLVVGVDSVPGKGEWADQMAVAWGADGLLGVGRKVFPTAGQEAAGMVINAADFGDPGRVVNLPDGRRGVLCSCYDGFGVSDPRRRAYPIERLRLGGRLLRYTDDGFDAAWEGAVAAWTELTRGLDAALIAIHGFGGRGNTSMWQRHGVATASAALGGGLAVAGAHFEKLPRREGVQTLAALGVPRDHLDAGHHRGAEAALPIAATGVGDAMVRWFAWG